MLLLMRIGSTGDSGWTAFLLMQFMMQCGTVCHLWQQLLGVLLGDVPLKAREVHHTRSHMA